MSRVTLTNPFDLLGDENEDRTNVPTPKKEQKPAAPAKPAAKPAATTAAVAKPAAKPEAKAPAKPAETKPASKPAAGNSSNQQIVKPAPPRDSNQNLQERDKETRAPRDKRDRPPRPAGDGAKRVFDRKSGTGRPKNELTRGGHGRGNWGGEVDAKEGVEALKEKEEKTEEKEEGETKEEKVTVEGEKKEGEPAKEGEATPAAPKEEETFTLDEYLKNRKAKAPQVQELKPRTVSDSDFGAAGLVALQRDDGVAAAKKDKKEKAPEKTEKADKADKTDKTDKAASDKKENLAAKLLTFATHQDARRQERGGSYRNYDDRRGGNDRRGGRQPNSNPRGPRPDYPNKGNNTAASQPPVQEKDFPALGPHGTESVKA